MNTPTSAAAAAAAVGAGGAAAAAGLAASTTTDSSTSSLAAAAAACMVTSKGEQQLAYNQGLLCSNPAGEEWTTFGSRAAVVPAAGDDYDLLFHQQQQQQLGSGYAGHQQQQQQRPGSAAAVATAQNGLHNLAVFRHPASPLAGSAAGHHTSSSERSRAQQGSGSAGNPSKPRGRSGPKSKFSPFIGVSQYKRTGRWEVSLWLVRHDVNTLCVICHVMCAATTSIWCITSTSTLARVGHVDAKSS